MRSRRERMETLKADIATAAEWDESSHPRDEKGRFGGGGGDNKSSMKATPSKSDYGPLGKQGVVNMYKDKTPSQFEKEMKNADPDKRRMMEKALIDSKQFKPLNDGVLRDHVKDIDQDQFNEDEIDDLSRVEMTEILSGK